MIQKSNTHEITYYPPKKKGTLRCHTIPLKGHESKPNRFLAQCKINTGTYNASDRDKKDDNAKATIFSRVASACTQYVIRTIHSHNTKI